MIFGRLRQKMAPVSIAASPVGMSSHETFPLITLQPVSDANNVWVALLLEAEPPLDGAALAELLKDHGLAAILENTECVVTIDPDQIDAALAAEIPAARMTLCFPVARAVDPARHAALAGLRAAGFRLMAAGFPEAGAPLPPSVESLAVTCPGHAMPPGFCDWLRDLPGPHLALGTTENVCPGFCKFHWLAGHLAGHVSPVIKGDPTARGLLLKLLSLVATDAETHEIEAVIKRDTNLSYHLLKLVNSVAFGPAKHITSFGQAIALLGRRQLQRWLQLLLYARSVGSQAASPLLPRAALRASLMEGLAQRAGLSREMQDHAFMAGMFSLLDALFGSPIGDIIAPLNLTDDVVRALTSGEGELGGLRTIVLASEGSPAPALADALAAAGIDRAGWAAALVAAARWAVQVAREA